MGLSDALRTLILTSLGWLLLGTRVKLDLLEEVAEVLVLVGLEGSGDGGGHGCSVAVGSAVGCCCAGLKE
ncbi:hypothetical protein PF005_g385 [Phytophthora fragariae]|uniref:Secreted protein n=1 Tax=Phytophthora fragariae TaxID=53985 RepID=A0A6A3ZK09_9STRA|nr:hypothetical protein PF005_g385 [Phytophthora fragariae]